jgi:thiamine kinase-like enzyme
MKESATEEESARRRLAEIPGIARDAAARAPFLRLPGLTNRVYRVDLPGGRFALRIPGDRSSAIVDRRTEEANARAAALAGVAPEVIHFGADGVMLTRFVDGKPLTPEKIVAPGALTRVGAALRRLHDSGAAFAGRFQPFGTSDRYRAVLLSHGVSLSARQQEILGEAEAVRAALAAHPVAEKPCHCDPTGRNLIDTGKRVWLVDWEYSGLNDPAWDLAYCAIQAGLPPDSEAELLSTYFDRPPTDAEVARVKVMKAPVELMSALWALIQESSGNRVADFRSYAETTFELSAARSRTPEFRESLNRL